MRPGRALVTFPKLTVPRVPSTALWPGPPEAWVVGSTPYCVWLNVLKVSTRNWKPTLSVNWNVLPSPTSQTIDESKRPGAHQGAEFCPSIGGGKDWPPETWSPQTKLLYIPANNNVCAYLPKGEVPRG